MSFSKNLENAVVYTIDEKYVPHFTASATSLLSHNFSTFDVIYLVVNFNSNHKIKKAIKYLESTFSIQVVVVNIENSLINELPIKRNHHVTHITYARLLISNILPSHVERVLYLDSDTIVIESLKDLINQNFDDSYLIAVNELDWGPETIPNWLQEKKLIGEGYFNAGVMLINLKRWRDESISDKLLEIADTYKEQLVFWDQDVLNIAFRNKWKLAEKKFNAFRLDNRTSSKPSIIHYAGVIKPWHLFCNHPYRNDYKYYRNKTPFKLIPTISQTLYSLVGHLLSRNRLTVNLVLLKQRLKFLIKNVLKK